MVNVVLLAAGLIGAVIFIREMDWATEISPEDAARSLLEMHAFCD